MKKRPSDAARWTRCPGSLAFTENYANESSDAANDGTLGHYVREQCLYWGEDAYDYVGFSMVIGGKSYHFDADYADAIQPGIDEIREYSGRLLVEEHVDTTTWVGLDDNGKRQGGTVDAGVIGKHLYFQSDLKAGRGVPVPAVNNDQQVIYALAVYEKYIKKEAPDCKQFILAIDQPRNHAPDAGGYWHLTLDQLLAEGERIKAAAIACDEPDAPLVASEEACKWCPAANVAGRKGGCPAHAKWIMDQMELGFDDLDDLDEWKPPTVAELTPERLIALADKKKTIINFLEYAETMALHHLVTHGPTGGKKAVIGRRKPLKWADEGAAEAFLLQKLSGEEVFNKRLITPIQAAKKVGKNYEVPSALVERAEPNNVIADMADARPALRPLEDEFDDQEVL